MTALNELIEIIKQKRKESEISNTLLRFVHDEAIRLLETEKQQQDEFAINFANWYEFTLRESDNLNERFTPKQLIEMFKKEKGL